MVSLQRVSTAASVPSLRRRLIVCVFWAVLSLTALFSVWSSRQLDGAGLELAGDVLPGEETGGAVQRLIAPVRAVTWGVQALPGCAPSALVAAWAAAGGLLRATSTVRRADETAADDLDVEMGDRIDRSVHDRSAHDRSAHDRSAHDRSAHDRSVHDRSAHDRSAHDRSAEQSRGRYGRAGPDARLRGRLLRMAQALSARLEPQEALSYLAEEARTLLGADLVGCWEVHVDRAKIRLAAQSGPSRTGPPVGSEISLHDPDAAVARVPRTRRAEIIHAVKSRGAGEISATLHAATGFESAMVVPVSDGERVAAVLVVGDLRDPNRFSQGDLERAHLLANAVAGALVRTQLFHATRRHMQILETLREIHLAMTGTLELQDVLQTITDRAQTHLKADAVSVLLSDPVTQELLFAAGRGFLTDGITRSRLGLGRGIAGRVAVDRSPLFVSDLARDERFTRAELVEGEGFVCSATWPLVVKGRVAGVLEVFHRQPFHHDAAWCNFAELLAGQAAVAIDNAAMLQDIRATHELLAQAYDATLAGWSRALDLRDRATEGHSERVAEMAVRLGRRLGMRDEELVHVRRGALLHDIGKLGVPDVVLYKPGPLDPEEWAAMARHTVLGYEMLAPIDHLRPALDIPHFHHEKWDGTGYPQGLRGEQIPMGARLFAVVDVWDALRSDRPYRRAWSNADALAHIRASSGSHFDPAVVKAFLDMLQEDGHRPE